MSSRYSKSSLSRLNRTSQIELIQHELYSIITELILSNEYFKKNIDFKIFIEAVNLNYADYVYRSRTLLLARILRDVKKADKTQLILITEALQLLLFEDLKSDSKVRKDNTSNYIDSLLTQFKRGPY